MWFKCNINWYNKYFFNFDVMFVRKDWFLLVCFFFINIGMVLKKGFFGVFRLLVRKDFGLVFKKARVNNKENNKVRCKNG